MTDINPLTTLAFEAAFEDLGPDYYDVVAAADFPQHVLRFRNDALLRQLGLCPEAVTDDHWIHAFGKFQGRQPLLAMRYHGYQFGDYNPFLGDGRGFLYGQLRGADGELYDLGTKGSGTTPYSRGGDGRLTLKGGVREVLAAEALQALGVRTSRCLSLVETGEALWRGDEPSPTRSSVMVRFSRSHIRFGSFERLDFLGRADLIEQLLAHAIATYYAPLLAVPDRQERYARFYATLVERVATLAAQWMAVGFCHGVLNTDNMSITGESFDYGPYAFIQNYDPDFTAAYFDYGGRYRYGNQPAICKWNLYMLQKPLGRVITPADLEAGLAQYDEHYQIAYRQLMLQKLGFDRLSPTLADALIQSTLALLAHTQVSYHDFFRELTLQFSPSWRTDLETIFAATLTDSDPEAQPWRVQWRQQYHHCLNQLPPADLPQVGERLQQTNPMIALLRPEIEAIWEPITLQNDWQPFYTLLQKIQHPYPPVTG